ncbi:unnamed protein product [Caenorhabditis brenneri]
MGFPILSLPLVPFRDILRMLDFPDLISMSFCSRRCHNTTKLNLYELKEWEICAVVNWYPGIMFKKGIKDRVVLEVVSEDDLLENQRRNEKVESIQIEKTISSVTRDPRHCNCSKQPNWHLASAWPNMQIGMLECGIYVTDLFKKNIHMMHFGNESMWMMNLPEKLPQAMVSNVFFQNPNGSTLTGVALTQVLEQCPSENLEIFGWCENNIRFVRFGNFRNLYVNCGLWVTVKHLAYAKCSQISVSESKWKCDDIRKFLLVWIYIGMPNLKWFSIGLSFDDNIREENVLDGLARFVRRTDQRRTFEQYNPFHTIYGWMSEDNYDFDGLEIHSRSGMVASIKLNPVLKAFRMAVWH